MRPKKILIVDDDPDVHMLLNVHLQTAGYLTHSACDGTSCITAARREQPDLVILDLGLPAGGGENALGTLRKLQQFQSVPFLVVSGRPEREWGERMKSAGANGYLEKPVDPARLVAAVRSLLGDSPHAAPAPATPAQVNVPMTSSKARPTELACPHCGHGIAELHATFQAETVEALIDAVRSRA